MSKRGETENEDRERGEGRDAKRLGWVESLGDGLRFGAYNQSSGEAMCKRCRLVSSVDALDDGEWTVQFALYSI